MTQPDISTAWWKEAVFYQIYMPSFCDSNGDGFSNFKGMTGKLDYLQALGIKGLWLTPFLKSPKVDNGYDVASYTEIDAVYGNKDDFIEFLEGAHDRGIKVIIDMVFNHTSTDHEWFVESSKSTDNPYRDYYIWKDEPNNWESFFGGSAWELDARTNQFYLHKFDVSMADLNWSNPKVIQEIIGVIQYWLELGVDGFRLDVINFLTTDQNWADNPVQDGKQIHLHDINQHGVQHAIRIIKSTSDRYVHKFIVGEVGSDQLDVLQPYQAIDLLDVVFNFNLGSIAEFSPQRIYQELQEMEEILNGYPTLFFSSHDMSRMLNRLANGNKDKALTLAALVLTAKGVPFIYYGEEIGMQNITANVPDEIIDIQGRTQYRLALEEGRNMKDALSEGNQHNRDKSRSPMQWNDQAYAGFSSQRPWIKVNENYKYINAEQQMQDDHSFWNVYRNLIAIRNNEKALQYGEYDRLEFVENRILYSRVYAGEKTTVLLNFGTDLQMELPTGAQYLMGSRDVNTNQFVIYKERFQI